MKPWEKYADAPEGGTGIDVPVQRGMRVSPEQQAIADQARLNILEKEKQANPNDPALDQEVTMERRKQGVSTPVAKKPWEKNIPQPEAAPRTRGYGEELGRQVGLTARNAIEGVASVPTVLGNAADYIGEKVTGKKLGFGGNVGATVADKLGLPKPETGIEKFSGDVAQTLLPAGMAGNFTKVPELTGKGLWRALGRNAAVGTTSGAAANMALGHDPVEGAVTGAVLGPVLSSVGGVAKSVLGTPTRWLQNVTAGAEGRASGELQKTLGPRTRAAIDALRNLRGEVPGEMPTAGRAASADLPELKILEELARSKPGASRYLERDVANEAARMRPLERIAAPGREGVATRGGQIPPSRHAAFRSGETDPLYAAAMSDRVTMTPEMEALVGGVEARPAVVRGGRAFRQEQTNAEVGGQRIPMGPVPAVPGTPAMPEVRDSMGVLIRPAVPEVPGTPGHRSIQDLQQIKNELSARIKRLSMSDPDEAHRLSVARDQLNRQMTEQSPNFAQANTRFRELSIPQNQADVAEALVRTLRDSKGVERPGAFLAARQNAPQVLKRADQSPRFQQIEQVMTGPQMEKINAVQRSLQREADYASLNTPRGILPKYLSPMDQLEQATPGWFSRVITLARSQVKRIGKRTDEDVYRVVNDAMLDPRKMADLLSQVPPTERNALINALRQNSASPAIMPQMVGAMSSNGQE